MQILIIVIINDNTWNATQMLGIVTCWIGHAWYVKFSKQNANVLFALNMYFQFTVFQIKQFVLRFTVLRPWKSILINIKCEIKVQLRKENFLLIYTQVNKFLPFFNNAFFISLKYGIEHL